VTRRSPLLALALVGLVTLTGCGARVSDDLRQSAADQALGRGGSGTVQGGSSGGGGGTTSGTSGTGTGGTSGVTSTAGGTTGGTSGGTGGSTSGTSGTTTGATTSGTAGGTTGGTSATGGSSAPAGGNGGATDVGVTANSITVANISDASGPVPGLFKGAVVGTQAYFAMINNQGGVFGRQIKVDFGDGQLQCDQNKSQTQARVSKVFAFVGNFSLYDDCGAQVLKQHLNVPDVSNVLGPATADLSSNFATAPIGSGWRTGSLGYFAQTYGDKWKHIGAIYASVGSGPTVWKNTVAAIKSTGGAVVHEEPYGATDTDFTGTIIKMKNDGVQLTYVNTTDGATTARFVNAARAQKVDWPIIFGGTGYDTNFIKQAGANANGVFDDQQFSMFFNPDEASNIPAVGQYQKWMNNVDSGQTKDLFSIYGWTSAQLFVDALKKAGPKATRKGVLAALKTITSFDGSGLLAPSNPAQKTPATCWLLTQVVDGKYKRVGPTPPKGFNCTGGYFVNKG
jgi:ABC-type branched-subunit amino acid transport system substrate-binding protein